MEMKKAIKNKNTQAEVVYLIFDKLQHLWKKYTINLGQNNSKKSNASAGSLVRDFISVMGSLVILSLILYIFFCKNKKKYKKE